MDLEAKCFHAPMQALLWERKSLISPSLLHPGVTLGNTFPAAPGPRCHLGGWGTAGSGGAHPPPHMSPLLGCAAGALAGPCRFKPVSPTCCLVVLETVTQAGRQWPLWENLDWERKGGAGRKGPFAGSKGAMRPVRVHGQGRRDMTPPPPPALQGPLGASPPALLHATIPPTSKRWGLRQLPGQIIRLWRARAGVGDVGGGLGGAT